MKKILIILTSILVISCMDFHERQINLQKMYPKNIITPATGIIADKGYQFLMEDTINNQIYAVKFGEFSYTRIAGIRNIK